MSPPNHRILIIDDNRAIHDDFRKILCPPQDDMDEAEAEFFGESNSGAKLPAFEIESAYQGMDGVEAARQAVEEGRPFAVAFVDVRMPPGIDGIETAQWLWQVCPDLQVVICTAHSDYSWQEMVDHLSQRDRLLVVKKPFAVIEVLQMSCALCEKWRLARDARDRLSETEKAVEERTRQLREANDHLKMEMEQRQRVEAQLLRTQRLESIGTLASGLAHDLNNMLAPILLAIGVLRQRMPAEVREMISIVESCAKQASELVQQVLTFARGVEGTRVLLSPNTLLHEVEKIISGTFPQHIGVEWRIAENLPAVEADAIQVQQVLVNLAVNARDAMPLGGVLRIEADELEVDGEFVSLRPGAQAGRYVRLRISDTGTGIAEEILDRIFDPFFTTKELGKGTGLGLSTAVGIVKGHGGFLDVQSELGRGSTFAVFLPAVGEALPKAIAVKATPSPSNGSGQLILLVDDEDGIRKVAESVLRGHGYRTLVAADGAEALSIYAREAGRIDAIVTDIMMPGMDGVALCKVLKELYFPVRIIATTGAGEEAKKQELRDLGASHILNKPYKAGDLLGAVGEALEEEADGAAVHGPN